MALTYTPKAGSAEKRPQFQAKTVFGEPFDSRTLEKYPVTLIAFICGHCPYVLAIEDRLIELSRKIEQLGGKMIAVCSNDPSEYEEDRPENLAARAKLKEYPFLYLLDESQDIAKSFGAVCTPDFFVYDNQSRLQYRGRLDDSWKNAAKVQKEELYSAVKSIVETGRLAPGTEVAPSMGCSIKWKD